MRFQTFINGGRKGGSISVRIEPIMLNIFDDNECRLN